MTCCPDRNRTGSDRGSWRAGAVIFDPVLVGDAIESIETYVLIAAVVSREGVAGWRMRSFPCRSGRSFPRSCEAEILVALDDEMVGPAIFAMALIRLMLLSRPEA